MGGSWHSVSTQSLENCLNQPPPTPKVWGEGVPEVSRGGGDANQRREVEE
jgi:hypothetical protein